MAVFLVYIMATSLPPVVVASLLLRNSRFLTFAFVHCFSTQEELFLPTPPSTVGQNKKPRKCGDFFIFWPTDTGNFPTAVETKRFYSLKPTVVILPIISRLFASSSPLGYFFDTYSIILSQSRLFLV